MGTRLSYASLPVEIKKIANASLGAGVLRSMFSYANTYHLLIKISDGTFVGFALYHYESDRVRDSGNPYIVGVIDTVCVDPACRREGFGTLLTFGTLRKMSAYGVDRIEVVLNAPPVPPDTEDDPGLPAYGSGALLESMGFRKVKTIEGYFTKASRKFGFECALCGSHPCTCQGVLFAIDEDDRLRAHSHDDALKSTSVSGASQSE